MEVQKFLVQYSYLKDPKQSQGVDNDWIKRGISFPSNVRMEELVTKISEKTKIPREYLEIRYKIPNSAEDEWFLLKDEDDFEFMMSVANMVQIQAIHKQSDGEEEHGGHTMIQPSQEMEVQRVLVQYSYLKDPKQSQGVGNDWINRAISFPNNVLMEELVTKISEKTKIPREYLEIHYKIPNSAEDEWLLLKDEDDFEVMMGGANMVQIQAIHKQRDGEEEHGVHTMIQPNQVVGELDDQAQTSQHIEALKGISNPTILKPWSTAANSSEYFDYDVFISFRGEDTRKSFTGHLYAALKQCGIRAFIDEKELRKGEKIDEIYKAIEKSAIFIPVFSKHYAESSWCLNEISKIVQCKREMLPIYYDIEPTDVRHQKGTFFEAFEKYAKDDKTKGSVDLWRHALKEVANISSFVLQLGFNGREADLIKVVVDNIFRKTKRHLLKVAEHPVGVDSHVAEVMKILNSKTSCDQDVVVVGIIGMGGIGKTTIAKSLFNQLSVPQLFDGSCFLQNTRENW